LKNFIVAALLLTGIYSHAQGAAQPPAANDKPAIEQSSKSGWNFAIGLGYSLSSKLKFDNGVGTSSGSSTSFSTDLDYKNTYSLSFEGRNMPSNSWGFMGGIQFDGEREFDGGTITSGGITATVSSSGGSKIQFTNLYANAVYRWDQFYLPFGLNVSSVKFTPASGSTGTSDASGGVGAQLGAGFALNENVALELFSRVVAIKLKGTTSTSTTDFGTGYLSTLIFQGKYIF
jgi:hypothetical protein